MNYRLAYAIGVHPWEDLAEHPPFADKLLELVAREEDRYGRPYGRALDIGTGSAVWGVRLAERGWEVTGIDIVKKALHRARERAEEERATPAREGCCESEAPAPLALLPPEAADRSSARRGAPAPPDESATESGRALGRRPGSAPAYDRRQSPKRAPRCTP